MGYIYLRTNKINGKKYVGQVIKKRFKTRQNRWNNLNQPYAGIIINNARAKYGIDAFDFEILKECKDDELNQWEMYYIKELNTKTPNGYNMTDGGDSSYERSDETRKKISDALRGKKLSPEHIAKHAAALRGRKRPAEVVAKVAAAKRGKHYPKMSAAHRGMKQSPEHIEKRVAKLRGRKRPEETKEKISATMRGKKLSEETKAKLSAAHRGMKLSPEHKAKISAGQKNSPKKSKAVQALDKVTGEVVMEFPSAAEAQRQYGFDSASISHCCLGKVKTHKGLIWRFAVQ